MVSIGSDSETFLLLVGGSCVLIVLLEGSIFLFPRALILVERDGFLSMILMICAL